VTRRPASLRFISVVHCRFERERIERGYLWAYNGPGRKVNSSRGPRTPGITLNSFSLECYRDAAR
jgi:hypothetical protein